MRMDDILILQESVDYDDKALVALYESARKEIRKRRKLLEVERQHKNDNNYLAYAVARLAYEFAKEEHDLLSNEIKKRGLTISI